MMSTKIQDTDPCSKCHMPRKPVRQCKCGGGGGGSSGDGSSDKKKLDESKGNDRRPVVLQNTDKRPAVDNTLQAVAGKDWAMLLRSNNPLINFDMIADLLAKQLLFIHDDKKIGMFTLKCNPVFLSELEKAEVKKLAYAINNEFQIFKNKYGIADKSCAVKIENDDKGNVSSLLISTVIPKLYDAFTLQLYKSLLPVSLLMKPIPSNQSTKAAVDDQSDAVRKYKSRTPFDAMYELIPKGLK